MGIVLPICAVTGRIAGDKFACGDCDPCSAAHVVPPVVKRLMAERDEFAEKYEAAALDRDELRDNLRAAYSHSAERMTDDYCPQCRGPCMRRPRHGDGMNL